MRDFVDNFGVGDFVHLADESGTLWQRFGATIRSSFLFVDDSGETQRTGYGQMTEARLRETVSQLAASPATGSG